jgi:hypothetical protein
MSEPSPEEQFDLLAAEMSDRMQEYLVALQEIPNADPSLKSALWNAASSKGDEIDKLRANLAALIPKLEEVAASPSPSLQILLDACRAVSWNVGEHKTDRSLIHACRQQVQAIKHPVARASALDWLRRALHYAESGRRNQAIQCVGNAKSQLGS